MQQECPPPHSPGQEIQLQLTRTVDTNQAGCHQLTLCNLKCFQLAGHHIDRINFISSQMLKGMSMCAANKAWSTAPSVLARKREREAKKEEKQAKKQERPEKKKKHAKGQTTGHATLEAKGDKNQEAALASDHEGDDRF